MTPHQHGRAAFAADTSRFDNPYPTGSAAFSQWRHGHDAAQSDAVFARIARKPTRQVGDHNINLGNR